MRIGTGGNKQKRTDEEMKTRKGGSSNGNVSLFAWEAVFFRVVVVAVIAVVAVRTCGLFVGGVQAMFHHDGCEDHLHPSHDAGPDKDEQPNGNMCAWMNASFEFTFELCEVLC